MNAEEKKAFIMKRFCRETTCMGCPLGVVFVFANAIGFRERALVCNLWIHSGRFESLPKGAQRILVDTLGEGVARGGPTVRVEQKGKLPDMWGNV